MGERHSLHSAAQARKLIIQQHRRPTNNSQSIHPLGPPPPPHSRRTTHMQRIVRTLLLAALALAVAASPSRKMLQDQVGCHPHDKDNVCTQAHVSDGCLTMHGTQYVCTTNKSGKTLATECTGGKVCDPNKLQCVREKPDHPTDMCEGLRDGCHQFVDEVAGQSINHYDGMCANGHLTRCPNRSHCKGGEEGFPLQSPRRHVHRWEAVAVPGKRQVQPGRHRLCGQRGRQARPVHRQAEWVLHRAQRHRRLPVQGRLVHELPTRHPLLQRCPGCHLCLILSLPQPPCVPLSRPPPRASPSPVSLPSPLCHATLTPHPPALVHRFCALRSCRLIAILCTPPNL